MNHYQSVNNWSVVSLTLQINLFQDFQLIQFQYRHHVNNIYSITEGVVCS